MSDDAIEQRTPEEDSRRWKDFWTLHVPLVVVLALCTYATINQYQRAMEGVDRSWVYMVEWPLIGLFAIFVWNRYRKHGSFSNWLGNVRHGCQRLGFTHRLRRGPWPGEGQRE